MSLTISWRYGTSTKDRRMPLVMGGDPNPIDRRILVLGTTPTARAVDSHQWDKLPAGLNIADYDVVIFDLVPLEDADLRQGVDIDHGAASKPRRGRLCPIRSRAFSRVIRPMSL
jgi:hypothetical protein